MLILIIIFVIKKQDIIFNKNRPLRMKSLKKNNKIPFIKTQEVNNQMLLMEKKELLDFISLTVGKKITFVKCIFIGNNQRFGNKIRTIYKIIFYCHILRCKKIFLDKKKVWFIKNKIVDKKYKIIIVPEGGKNIKFCKTIIDNTSNFYYYSKFIIHEKRIDLLKKEILINLPKIKTNPNDLFIYIRSGDIFVRPHRLYSQPPLCFYYKILDNYMFRNYYLIAENKNNPVVAKILEIKPNIIYNRNPLKIDISYLTNAYNLVGGRISTFLDAIIPLNNNLKNLWIFLLKTENKEKYNKFRNHKTNIYEMNASYKYIKNMKLWSNLKLQRNLMIDEICINEFKMFSLIK